MNQEAYEIMKSCLAMEESEKRVLTVSSKLNAQGLLQMIVLLAQMGMNIRAHKFATRLEVKCLRKQSLAH